MKALYEIGDVCLVRELEDLIAEFGQGAAGVIRTPCSFVPEMREFCGRPVTIRGVRFYNGVVAYNLEEDRSGWNWDECVLLPKDPDVSIDDFLISFSEAVGFLENSATQET